MAIHIPSLPELKRALHIHETIESLKNELASIFGGAGGTGAQRGRKPGRKAATAPLVVSGDEAATIPATPKQGRKKAKRVMSPEAREKIAAAQRKRWAKQKKAAK
jgi:hypothetical protein